MQGVSDVSGKFVLFRVNCKLQWHSYWLRMFRLMQYPLQWRHNDHDGVSNHQPRGCLLNRLFRRRSKKTSKLHVTSLCVGNSPWPVNSPHKRASYEENVSIWWRHHVCQHLTRKTSASSMKLHLHDSASPFNRLFTCFKAFGKCHVNIAKCLHFSIDLMWCLLET